MSTNDLMEEYEAEVIDLLNAATKEAFIAGFEFVNTYNMLSAEEAYNEWAKDNE